MTPSPRPRPSSLPRVEYKGAELDAARGPGLGCFWVQLVLLVVLVVVTPVGVGLGWPDWLNALLLFATIALLLVAGQTIIFLLRIVAAERREGRRRPMAIARSQTVGELEDEGEAPPDEAAARSAEAGPGGDPDEAGPPRAADPAAPPAADGEVSPPIDPRGGGAVRE